MNLNQITIPVSNVVKSISFYQSLGLKLIVHSHDIYARFDCWPNGTTLSLHKVDHIAIGDKTIIYFERVVIDDFVKTLQ